MPIISRLKPYYDSPELNKNVPVAERPTPEPVPVGPIAKRECLSQGFFEAFQFLRSQIRHSDEKIATDAAKTIISLQQTHLRHGGQIMGTHMPDSVFPFEPPEAAEKLRYPDGLDVKQMAKPLRIEWQNLLTSIRRDLQLQADQRGLGEFISLRECIAKALPFLPALAEKHKASLDAQAAAKKRRTIQTPQTE
jgi:hypothetical protein